MRRYVDGELLTLITSGREITPSFLIRNSPQSKKGKVISARCCLIAQIGYKNTSQLQFKSSPPQGSHENSVRGRCIFFYA